MPLYIRDDGVDALAERLMSVTSSKNKTEAVRAALKHELERVRRAIPLHERIKKIQAEAAVNGRTAEFDQKAFSDWLNGE
ncbi:MAG TPA: type II toxin-antitoxin system VapB family antitoxin [Mesorhizobium sp.]